MSEKMSEIERPEPIVIGSVSAEKKEEYKQVIVKNFGEHHYEQIPEDKREILEYLEYEKEPYEKSAIEQSNKITNRIIKNFGLPIFDVPERNVHIVPDDLYIEIGGLDSSAVTFEKQQMIVLNQERLEDPITKTTTIFHEIIHLKNFVAIEGHENFYRPYRSGFIVNSLFKKEEKTGFFSAFSGLNEAVVSEIEKKHFHELISKNEYLENEYLWGISKEAQGLKKEVAERDGVSVDEILKIDRVSSSYNCFPYYEQRRVLNYIVDTLYENNGNDFNSRDEIMNLFFKSHFDGKLLPIARLIKKCFGEEAFGIIATMGDGNSAKLVLNYLIKNKKKKLK